MLMEAQNIQFQIDETVILQHINFQLQQGEHIGIVGPNGAGKSTLLHIIHQDLLPTDGQLITSTTTSLMKQEEQLSTIQYTKEEAALLAKWHVPERPYTQLSGGEQLKWRLAKTLAHPAPIILLDEPTNHLDEHSVQQLITTIKNSKKTYIIVSHDRYFLDAIATTIWSLDDQQFATVKGNYSHYAQWYKKQRAKQQHDYEQQQKHIAHVEQQMADLEQWSANMHKESTANHHPKAMGAKEYYRLKAKRADKQVKSKRKLLQKNLEKQTIEQPKKLYEVNFSLSTLAPKGKRILQLKNGSISPLLQHINLTIMRGERVAIMGNNGVGKSTLLNHIVKQRFSDDVLWLSPTTKIGYLQQSVFALPEDETIASLFQFENFKEEGGIRTQLIHLGFKDSQWQQLIGTLSMGERIKLVIANFIFTQCDFLILDEPSNHLDLASREQLEAALLSYNGTILFVSHDRYLREKLATRTVMIEKGSLHVPKTISNENADVLTLETEKQEVLGKLSFLTPSHKDYAALDARFNEILQRIKQLKE